MRFRGLVGIFSAAWIVAASLRGAENLTAHQMLAKARQDWLAAGKPVTTAQPEFGLESMTAVEVQAYAFQPGISNDLILDDGNGYRYYGTSTPDPYMAGAVQLPTGVSIDYLKFSACVANAGDLVLGLYDNSIAGQPNTLIASLPIDFADNCGNASFGPINYTYSQSAQHPLYFVVFFANNPADGTVKFNNAQIYYHRLVSPAPASATFVDVPTSDPAFQYIEALAASGVTGGCGNGNYCPDSPLTRRQMAVFLAKALGLHWPG